MLSVEYVNLIRKEQTCDQMLFSVNGNY